jgi:hypothetical protein
MCERVAQVRAPRRRSDEEATQESGHALHTMADEEPNIVVRVCDQIP